MKREREREQKKRKEKQNNKKYSCKVDKKERNNHVKVRKKCESNEWKNLSVLILLCTSRKKETKEKKKSC